MSLLHDAAVATSEEIDRHEPALPLCGARSADDHPARTVPLIESKSPSWTGGMPFMVRVFVDVAVEPAVVVTTYRTTKIEKYRNRSGRR